MILKILQWNIWYKENPEDITRTINQISPDIVCLQEVTVNYSQHQIKDIPKYLAKQTGLNCHFQEAQYWPVENGKAVQGNAILSKGAFASKSHIFVQNKKHENFDDYSREGRILVVGEIEVGGKHLTVATTHLSYQHRFEETQAKLEEENRLLEAIARFDQNFILTGDFNVSPKSNLIKKLSKNLINAGPEFDQNTWTTKPFSYNGFEETQLNWRLDYIFTTPDIKVNKAEIIQTEFSDHLPILIEIEV